MVCIVKEENNASLLEGRSSKMSSLVSDGCWFPVVPSLLQPSISSEVSELFPSCDFNWLAMPEPMESKQGKADSEEIDSLVACMGLYLVSSVGFFEGCNCVCDQGWCTRGSDGQRTWFLLVLLVHIIFALNADDAFAVASEGWWDWIVCGNGISECSGFVVAHWDEL